MQLLFSSHLRERGMRCFSGAFCVAVYGTDSYLGNPKKMFPAGYVVE